LHFLTVENYGSSLGVFWPFLAYLWKHMETMENNDFFARGKTVSQIWETVDFSLFFGGILGAAASGKRGRQIMWAGLNDVAQGAREWEQGCAGCGGLCVVGAARCAERRAFRREVGVFNWGGA
jgi:hypothetical protein